jgi:hypothetical protein
MHCLPVLLLFATLDLGISYFFNRGEVNHRNNYSFEKGRRGFLAGYLTVLVAVHEDKPVASAAYGDSVNIQFPNYIEFLIEKNKVVDSSETLYQGADPGIVLKRLLAADNKLRDIPILVSEKKWSQIQGLLSGPLGTLSETLNLIAGQSPSKEMKSLVKKVKAEILAISVAAAKKDSDGCISGAQAVSSDLESIAKLKFQ